MCLAVHGAGLRFSHPQSSWQRNSLSLFTNRSFTHTLARAGREWQQNLPGRLEVSNSPGSRLTPPTRLCSNCFHRPFHFSGCSRWTCAIKATTHIHLHSATFSCFLSLTIQRCFLVLALVGRRFFFFHFSSSACFARLRFLLLFVQPGKAGNIENKNNEALSENWSRNKENRSEKFRRSYCEQRQGLCCRSGSVEGSFVRRNLQRFMAATLFQSFPSLLSLLLIMVFVEKRSFNWF